MTNFILIDPLARSVHNLEAPDWRDAARAIGLDPSAVDHGTVARSSRGHGFGIWVYEWGLKAPLIDRYFSLNRQLFNGPAVLYAFDAQGETVDCPQPMADHIRREHLAWYDSAAEAERAIMADLIDRPESSINGEVFWRWEAPKPAN